MNDLPDPDPDTTYYSVDAVRRIDRAAIDGIGIAGYTLMTRAASAALAFALDRYGSGRKWLVLCGGGNNAGDGYVLARLARDRGIEVTVRYLVGPDSLAGDAKKAANDLAESGLSALPFEGDIDPDYDLIVDAMLGSGLEREVGGDFRQAVEAANRHSAPVLAIDVPTGLNGDSGRILGVAISADATVTFVGLKTGLVLADGPSHCGEVVFDDLAIPETARDGVEAKFRCLPVKALAAAFPRRSRDAHKGHFGHVLIAGGAPGMSGAVRIAGEAALRSGAGLVSIATHPLHAATVNVGRPELMVHAVDADSELDALLERASVIALGPGLGQDAWAQWLLDRVLASRKPVVLDADALNLIARQKPDLYDAVLTPHPGEAARMLGIPTSDIQDDRLRALGGLAERYAATVILKGAGSLVSSTVGPPWLSRAGNPGMASGGMGDALTGVVASLRAQGFGAEAAAVFGVELHGRAGDIAAGDGQRGLLAGDLIGALRRQVNP